MRPRTHLVSHRHEAGASASAAAAGNWRWLTELTRTDSALLVGHPADPLSTIMALQFAAVVTIDRTRGDAAATLKACADQAFDYAALPGALEWWQEEERLLCRTLHRVLRADGWVAIAGNLGQGPAALGAGLRLAGFREVRRYALAPSYDTPFTIIPRTRRAAVACEQDRRRQQGGNHTRLALAACGLHGLLYGGWLVLAAR